MSEHHDDVAIQTESGQGITVPKWFLMVATALVTVLSISFIPWSIWVTNAIIKNSERLERVNENTDRLDKLEDLTNHHAAQLQVMSATRFTADHGEAIKVVLETKIDRLAERMDARVLSLQRDLDRRFPKAIDANE